MTEPPAKPARAVDLAIELNATPEEVWRALTNAAEITRWFATHAAVEPGAGGTWAIDWDGHWPWRLNIAAWEPGRRLRLEDPAARPMDADGKALDAEAPVAMALEFTMETRAGRTRLRLVHSGFGHGASWDDEIDGVRLGWNGELRVLRHYLEHHPGRERQLAWARRVMPARDAASLWRGLTSPGGVVLAGAGPTLQEGDRCTLALATGDQVNGRVLFAHPNRHLQVAADNLDGAVFTLQADRAAGEWMVQLRLCGWHWSPEQARSFATKSQEVLNRFAG